MRRVCTVAAVLLVALYALGRALPLDPDFDWTFGIDAFSGASTFAFAGAAVALAAIVVVPGVAPALGAVLSRIPERARLPLLLIVQFMWASRAPDVSLSGDGMDLVDRVATGQLSPAYPLTSWLHAVLHELGTPPIEAVRATSVGAGLVLTTAIHLGAHELFDDTPRQWATTALAATVGATALGFGSLEVYAPFCAVTAVYLWLAIHSIRRAETRPWAALALGVALTTHGAALLLFPSLYWVYGGRPNRPLTLPTLLRVGAALIAPFLIARLGTSLAGWTSESAIEAGRVGLGPWTTLGFLPLTASAETITERYAMFEGEHLAAVGGLWLRIACVPLLLAVSTLVLRGGRRETEDDASPHVMLLVATLPLFLLPVVWNVSYELRRDWDLFAVAGIPVAFLVAARVFRREFAPGDAVRIAALGLFALVPVVIAQSGDTTARRHFAVTAEWSAGARGDGESADRWSARAQELDPDGGYALALRAGREARGGDWSRAVASVEEAARLAPDDWYVRTALGRALEGEGRADEAIREYELALRHPRQNIRHEARLGLARIHERRGDRATAIHHLTRAVREDSERADVPDILRRLVALHRAEGDEETSTALEGVVQRLEELRRPPE